MIGVMRARINCRLWAGAALLGLLGGGQSALAADRYDGLEPCELSAAGGRVTVAARCGYFEVAENPDQPDGRQIELAYAVLPARARAQADPVFFLAGGPGQSARETAPMMRAALREVNRTRDLIFLDQRGTGGSNLLDCQFEDQDDWLEMDVEALDQRLRECQAEWDADVRFYTTAHGADDIELLRQRYGFEQINLIGGSYGTRMAQVYLKRYPDRVRRVVIDGVAPTRLHLGSEHGLKLDLALERVFAACQAEPSCNEAFPELAEAYQTLLARYIDNGQDLVITHPRTGTGMDLRFTRDVLAGALRFLAYSPTSQMMIPYLVHEAATTGDPSRMAAQALITYEQMDDMIAIGLNFAVGCSEDWPGWPRDLDQSHTLLGNSMTEFYARVCDWWPAGEVDPDFHQPFDSEAPILILSGELDPVTPPEYGEEALAQFSYSRHLVGTGLGHIVSTDPCFGRIIAQFIAGTELDELDVACIERLGPSPFFINLLGPTP
jgi:pimeloyl-ACP methyl ester carboxylesterase